MMKRTLLITGLLVLSTQLFAANVGCAKIGRYLRPATPDAIKLAKYLKVTTCNGKSFKSMLVKKNTKMTVVKASSEMILKYKNLDLERTNKKSNGFDF